MDADVSMRIVADHNLRSGTILGPVSPKSSISGHALDPLACIAFRSRDDYPSDDKSTTLMLSTCLASRDYSWLMHVRTARYAEEQNVEVSIFEGQIQYRTAKDVLPGEELRVWFGAEFSQILRLPAFASLVLPDTEKKYRCVFCSENFNYPYPMIGHIMYRCPIRDTSQPESLEAASMRSPSTPPSPPLLSPPSRMISPGLSGSTPNSPSTTPPNLSPGSSWTPATVLPVTQMKRKRFKSFDIASLTDEGEGPTNNNKDKSENGPDAVITNLNQGLNLISPLHGSPQFPTYTPLNGIGSTIPPSLSPYSPTGLSSPFSVGIPNLARSPPAPKPRKAPKRSKASPSPPSAPSDPAQAALLSCLPPSLAALSMPSQNWCAKCNTTFRMTSDLVYHMRSHHKREGDPMKRKREEKLRCLICHETFRERHHLTRHMTSHQ